MLTAVASLRLVTAFDLIGAVFPAEAVFKPVLVTGDVIGFLVGAVVLVFRSSPADEVVLVFETTDVRLVVELDFAAAVVVVVDVAVFWAVV